MGVHLGHLRFGPYQRPFVSNLIPTRSGPSQPYFISLIQQLATPDIKSNYGGRQNAVSLTPQNKGPFANSIFSVSGFFSRRFEVKAMKNRVWIIALAIIALSAFSFAPRTNAEPLTILAIVGVATVLSASTVDIVASHYEDNQDQRAQNEQPDNIHAKAEATGPAADSRQVEDAPRQN